MRVSTIGSKVFRVLRNLVGTIVSGYGAYFVYSIRTVQTLQIDNLMVFMWIFFTLVMLFLTAMELLKPAIRSASREEKRKIAEYIYAHGYGRLFGGRVKITKTNSRARSEVVYGPKMDRSEPEEDKESLSITFMYGITADIYPLPEMPNYSFLNYLIWEFGEKYMMVCHRTQKGYGEPYIKI